MGEQLNPELLVIEQLSSSNIPKEFDCTDNDLNEFITEDAFKHQEEHVAVTDLVYYDGELAGFFSLAADCISLDLTEKEDLPDEIQYSEYPALKICRFAICHHLQDNGLGRMVFDAILGFAIEELQPFIGIRYISVDAYRDSEEFYAKLGFVRNVAEIKPNQKTVSMRIDLQPIKE